MLPFESSAVGNQRLSSRMRRSASRRWCKSKMAKAVPVPLAVAATFETPFIRSQKRALDFLPDWSDNATPNRRCPQFGLFGGETGDCMCESDVVQNKMCISFPFIAGEPQSGVGGSGPKHPWQPQRDGEDNQQQSGQQKAQHGERPSFPLSQPHVAELRTLPKQRQVCLRMAGDEGGKALASRSYSIVTKGSLL